jgi:hypothetical protein
MFRSRPWVIAAVVVLAIALGLVIRNQIKVYGGRQAPVDYGAVRQALFDALQPVHVTNCELERFGEEHDGGYLMCANLLAEVQAGYSYGISGYDKWGCDVATRRGVPLHQYDCFDTTQPVCLSGETRFHAECVGGKNVVEDGRRFDTIENQLRTNGDGNKRIVMKMDVEGAEWDSLLAAPDSLLRQIDQLAIEFHWVQDGGSWVHDPRYLRLVERLKRHFHVAHLHFNNFSCVDGLRPFPAWAYEVLFVSKRLGTTDGSGAPPTARALDAPNNALAPDCQP